VQPGQWAPHPGRNPNEKLLDGLKKTITKGGINDFPDFTNEDQYVKWSEEVRNIAALQDMGDILDPAYVPNPTVPFEADLFGTRNLFMYAVFSKHVKTPQGITIVRQHATLRDGQAVWRGLNERYVTSQSAQLRVSKLRTEIISARLTPAYPGKYEHFLDKFTRMIADHQEITPLPENYTEDAKISMLHTALSSVPELMSVRTNLSIYARAGLPLPTYEDIVQMYKDLCAGPDSTRTSSGTTRSTNIHNIYHYGEQYASSDDDDGYQVHAAVKSPRKPRRPPTPVTPDGAQSNKEVGSSTSKTRPKSSKPGTLSAPRKPRLTKEIWSTMSQQEQKAWDVLTDATKAKIIRYGMDMAAIMTRAINFVSYTDEDSCDEDGFEADDTPHSLMVNKTERQPDASSSPGQLMKFFGRKDSSNTS
jgi:hypothetical protein